MIGPFGLTNAAVIQFAKLDRLGWSTLALANLVAIPSHQYELSTSSSVTAAFEPSEKSRRRDNDGGKTVVGVGPLQTARPVSLKFFRTVACCRSFIDAEKNVPKLTGRAEPNSFHKLICITFSMSIRS